MKSKDVLKLLKMARFTLCRWVKECKLRAIAMKMHSKRRKNKLKMIQKNLEVEQ